MTAMLARELITELIELARKCDDKGATRCSQR
jgi:cellobiose-specific phosphotransferase system component IIA